MQTPFVTRTACPACASADAPILIPSLDFKSPALLAYFRSFYPAPSCAFIEQLDLPCAELRSCITCGTIFHGRVPADPVLSEFYSILQSATFEAPRELETHYQEQRILELMMVVRYLQPNIRRPAVLDFGTGDGSWARLASAAGCDTSASDTADDSFASLSAAGVKCLQPEHLPQAAFDFINIEQVFEHLADPFSTLSLLVKALRPGGILKIGVPHDSQLLTKLNSPDWGAPKHSPDSLNSVAPIEHLNAFTPAGLALLGRRANLLPMEVSGWSLLNPNLVHRPSIRARLMRRLRDSLGQRHRPPYTLAQTRFFLRPI